MRSHLLILYAIAVPALLLGLGWAQLVDWDENIYAGVARNIARTGELIQLRLNGQPFAEKPPLVLWEMAAAFRLLGVSEYAARLPSALNGLAFLAFLVWMGRRLFNARLGWLWAMVFLGALFPLVLARSAVIDHTFNALMAVGAFTLYLYDRAYERVLAGQERRSRMWAWLLTAAVAMGLAVLAKGPVGGVVPLVAFGAAKVARPRPYINLRHFTLCGVVALSIALSWYAANLVLAGEAFLQGFIDFQSKLFSKPLEGHSGPFYYHFSVALVAFFPWTPLLLLGLWEPVRRRVLAWDGVVPVLAMCVGWVGFVLVLFSFVSTKLPHYSSVIYIPLALLVALLLAALSEENERPPWWIAGLFGLYGVVLGVVLGALPYALQRLAAQAGEALSDPPQPPPLAFWPGLVLVVGIVGAAALLWQRRVRMGVAVATAGMALLVLGLWRVHLPLFLDYNQGPMLRLMRHAYAQDGDLALYRTVSFAVLFYGDRPVEMLHTYKFEGDPSRLDRPGERPLYVVTPQAREQQLVREHPRLKRVREAGDLALYVLPPQEDAPAKLDRPTEADGGD